MLVEKIPKQEREALLFFNQFLDSIIPKMKEDNRLNFNIQMCKTLGTMVGNILKNQLNGKKKSPISVFETLRYISTNMNIEMKVIEQTPYKVTIKIGNCPIYNKMKKLGFNPFICCENYTINFLKGVVKAHHSLLNYYMTKFRKDQDDFCLHELIHMKYYRLPWYVNLIHIKGLFY